MSTGVRPFTGLTLVNPKGATSPMATGLALDACKTGFTSVNSGLEQFFNDPANVNICTHCCPVRSRIESDGCQDLVSRVRSRTAEVPVKWEFSRTGLG
jgi:hypothetical protein